MVETGKASEGHESSEEVCTHPNVFSPGLEPKCLVAFHFFAPVLKEVLETPTERGSPMSGNSLCQKSQY